MIKMHQIIVMFPQHRREYIPLCEGLKDHIHKVYSGHDKQSDKDVVISTWQSLYKLPKSYFKQFQCIFGDEAHTFKAKSLTKHYGKVRGMSLSFWIYRNT